MKRFNKLFSLFLITFAFFAFSACQLTKPTIEENGEITVVVNESVQKVYTVSLSKLNLDKGALSVMLYLKEAEGLAVEYEDGQYGAYFSKIGDISSDNNGYLSIFTSYEREWDVTAYCVEREYNGVTVKTSAVGISSMSILDGMILYFDYIAY